MTYLSMLMLTRCDEDDSRMIEMFRLFADELGYIELALFGSSSV